MKIEIQELIENVKEELLCYEESGEQMAKQWEAEFKVWLEDKKIPKGKSIKEEKGKKFFVIQDEGEIMEIADSYYDAVEEKSVKRYWKEFQ